MKCPYCKGSLHYEADEIQSFFKYKAVSIWCINSNCKGNEVFLETAFTLKKAKAKVERRMIKTYNMNNKLKRLVRADDSSTGD